MKGNRRIFFVSISLFLISFVFCYSHYGQVRTSDKIIEAAKTGNLNMVMYNNTNWIVASVFH